MQDLDIIVEFNVVNLVIDEFKGVGWYGLIQTTEFVLFIFLSI